MKFNKSTCLMLLVLFATVAVPDRVAGQGQTDNKNPKPEHRRYRLIDIGTFGGPESYINPAFTFGSHNQINVRGTVVGGAATSIPIFPAGHGFVCGGLDGTVPFLDHAFKWQDGLLTDLGALPAGDNCSVAKSVNARGEIAGVSENGVNNPLFGIPEIRAVLWKDEEIKDLGTLGGNMSAAGGINDQGQVVGFALNAFPDPFSIFDFGLGGSSNGTETRAFLWQEGAFAKDLVWRYVWQYHA
jgi:uncharacterized membrane protein